MPSHSGFRVAALGLLILLSGVAIRMATSSTEEASAPVRQSVAASRSVPTARATDPEPVAGEVAETAPVPPEAWPAVETVPDARGMSRRTRIVRTGGKYPLLRHVEQVAPPVAGARKVEAVHAMVADHIAVSLRRGTTSQQIEALAKRTGCTVRRRLASGHACLLAFPLHDAGTFAAMQALLAAQPEVRAAEPDWVVSGGGTPDDVQFSQQWGLDNWNDADIDAPEAWDMTTGSRSVLVGVIDSGVDRSHPDLAANCWVNPGEDGLDDEGRDRRANGVDDDVNGYVDDWRGWDFCNDDNDPMDDHGHGTHCAGIIGAVGGNGIGITGVCQAVSLVGIKFLGSNNRGYTSDAIDAVAYANSIDCDILSNSWGADYGSQILQDVLDATMAEDRLFVVAAMNNGSNLDDYPGYPASFANGNQIVVAATDGGDSLAWFSNYGEIAVDLAAPGDGILSTLPGGGYGQMSGTSMAAPHVAGVAALLLSIDPQLTAIELKERILRGVDLLPELTGRCLSGGRLNAANAVGNLALSAQFALGVPETTPVEVVDTDWPYDQYDPYWFSQSAVSHNGGWAMQSNCNHTYSAKMTMVVEGAAGLSFWWKGALGYIQCTVDGVQMAGTWLDSEWVRVEIPLQSGIHTVAWEFYVDYNVYDYESAVAWVDDVEIRKPGIDPPHPTPPQIRVQAENIEHLSGFPAFFGPLPAGEVSVLSFMVSNRESDPLRLLSAGNSKFDIVQNLTGANWALGWRFTPGELLPSYGNTFIWIYLFPTEPTWGFDLVIPNSDPANPYYRLPVRGTATGRATVTEALDLAHPEDLPPVSIDRWFGQTGTSWDGVDAATTGYFIAPGNGCRFDLTVHGPARVSFHWRQRSSTATGSLRLHIDDEQSAEITGESDWAAIERDVPEGDHILSWRYQRGHLSTSDQDRAWVDAVVITPLVPDIAVQRGGAPCDHDIPDEPPALTAGQTTRLTYAVLNRGILPLRLFDPADVLRDAVSVSSGVAIADVSATFIPGGMLEPGASAELHLDIFPTAEIWTLDLAIPSDDPDTPLYRIPVHGTTSGLVSVAQAIDHADAGALPPDAIHGWCGQSAVNSDGVDAACTGHLAAGATASFAVDVAGPAWVSYRWRRTVETSADQLRFLIDGEESAAADAESGWVTVRRPIGAGDHVLSWTYAKDPLASSWGDRAWVDQLVIAPDDQPPVVQSYDLHVVGTVEADVVSIQLGTVTVVPVDGRYDLTVPVPLTAGQERVEVPLRITDRAGLQRTRQVVIHLTTVPTTTR